MTDYPNTEIRLAELEAILSTAVDAIVTIDRYGIIQSVNPATESMFGYSRQELIGQNVSLLMPSPFREQHDDYLANYLATGNRKIIGIGREVVGRRRDGTTFPMHLAVSEFELQGKHYFTGIVRDITDLKIVEQKMEAFNTELEQRVRDRTRELRQAQAELVRNERFATLGKVAGSMAHEIRNPLNAVKTSAYFLLNANEPPTEKINEHLERIDRQVTLIDNVITALSDVAKLPAPHRKPIQLDQSLCGLAKTVDLPSNIQLEFDFPDQLPAVLIDLDQVSIAFRNLIRNARDAMPDGGTLTVGAIVEDNQVGFFIRDTGVGISEDQMNRILEPLYTTKARGMGLGLAITVAIVEKNQGRLEMASELAAGSCFTVWLARD